MLDSGTFICRSRWVLDEPEADLADLGMPDLRATEVRAVGGPMQSLGHYYAQWGQLVLDSIGQLQRVNNGLVARLHQQLNESQNQVEELVGSVLQYRAKELETSEARQQQDKEATSRHQLAHMAVQQVGAAANLYLGSRGLPPEIAQLVEPLVKSPELQKALRDPRVRELMKDPENIRSFAEMLQASAESMDEAEEKMSD